MEGNKEVSEYFRNQVSPELLATLNGLELHNNPQAEAALVMFLGSMGVERSEMQPHIESLSQRENLGDAVENAMKGIKNSINSTMKGAQKNRIEDQDDEGWED